VSIGPLLEGAAFSPEDVVVLTTAFEDCLRALKVVDRIPVVTLVAKRIIDLAKHGERNPASLREQVLQSFKTGSA
jgi:hypothetical protein